MRQLKILLAHSTVSPIKINFTNNDLVVTTYFLTPPKYDYQITQDKLNHLWAKRNKGLMGMYDGLSKLATNYDVLVDCNSSLIHPEFLALLPTFNIFLDRGLYKEDIRQPFPNLSANYDAVFYQNLSHRFLYEQAGCKQLMWTPSTMLSVGEDFEPIEDLFEQGRNTKITFAGNKNVQNRNRLEALKAAFPEAQLFGIGWPNKAVKNSDLARLYQSTQIGWDIHDYTGPSNERLFMLAIYGVLPICDNKTGVGQIFTLGEEVVGFDTIPEAVELTHYYLNHSDERIEIAQKANGRFWQDYNSKVTWQRIGKQIQEWVEDPDADKTAFTVANLTHSTSGFYARNVFKVVKKVHLLSKNLLSRNEKKALDESSEKDDSFYLGRKHLPYLENPEMKGVNMAQKRLMNNEPLDWPNILALNWAITSLIGSAKRIVEIGSGTGPFAEFASVDPQRSIDCFEEDDFARDMAERIRSRSNVRYYKSYNAKMKGIYDLLVSVEVIEHVNDLKGFLSFCTQLAPRAIFTTPNRVVLRGNSHIGPPPYSPHVREFSPGELYWLLKLYYVDVYLYHMPNVYLPWIEPMTIVTNGTPIIAECSTPI